MRIGRVTVNGGNTQIGDRNVQVVGGPGAVHTPGDSRPARGVPFITGDPSGPIPEKLLYADDLTVEPAALRMLLGWAPAVCRLVVTTARGVVMGSGFRVGADLVLTNEHVLRPDGCEPNRVLVQFNYEMQDAEHEAPVDTVLADLSRVRLSREDDWGLIALRSIPGPWPVVPLTAGVTIAVGEPAYVIQHPVGLHKRIGLVRNPIEHVDARVIHYMTDTQVGSSGSPVLNRRGELIALHHASAEVSVQGARGAVWRNEGIHVERVRAGLLAAGVVCEAGGAWLR
jgi:S1-C subfamily serine protease